VVLFDLLNEGSRSRGFATNGLIHELELEETADAIYLLKADGRLYAVHGLSTEGEVCQPGGAAWTRHIKPLMDEALRTALRLRPTEVDVALRVGLICASVGRADRATVDGPGPQKYCLGLAMEYRSLWVQCALIAAKICRFHATTASVERDARPVSSAFRPQVNPWRVRELLAARNVCYLDARS
jgi:hypothetical protein